MRQAGLAIAVIDENRDRAALIEEGLREAGYSRVHLISNLKGVIASIEELSPDVIVMDLGIPNRDLLEHMFRLSRAVQKPIAMFVDQSDEQTMLAAVEAGVSAYIVDGLKKDRVKSILDLAIIRFRAFEQLRTERDAVGNRMFQEIIDARALGRVHRQKAALQVPHQQPLTFEHAPDPLADPAHQLLKGRHRRRRHPTKG